jgi:hypothetical protein
MRLVRSVTPLAALLAAATLAGCRRGAPAPGTASAPPAAWDSVAVMADTTKVAATTDTVQGRPGAPPPDDCRYADRRPLPQSVPEGTMYDSAALANGVTYRCRLRPDGPEVRLVVLGEWSIPMAVDVYSPADASTPLQRLFLESVERRYEGTRLVMGEDLNGDGWTDLLALTSSGSGGGIYDVFLYSASLRRFEKDTVLSNGTDVNRRAGRPCVGTGGRMGVGNWTSAERCWSGGRWVLVRTVDQDGNGTGVFVRTTRERRDGRMQVIRVDTLTDPNAGLH